MGGEGKPAVVAWPDLWERGFRVTQVAVWLPIGFVLSPVGEGEAINLLLPYLSRRFITPVEHGPDPERYGFYLNPKTPDLAMLGSDLFSLARKHMVGSVGERPS